MRHGEVKHDSSSTPSLVPSASAFKLRPHMSIGDMMEKHDKAPVTLTEKERVGVKLHARLPKCGGGNASLSSGIDHEHQHSTLRKFPY